MTTKISAIAKLTAAEGKVAELYRDDEAMAVHGKGDGMRAAMRTVGGFLAGPPEIFKMTPLAAKGLVI